MVKGAVLAGMGIGMDMPPKVKQCPRHYGISVAEHYSEQTVRDRFDGNQMVPLQLIWLVRKGDVILPSSPIESKFGIKCRFTAKLLDKKGVIRVSFVATVMDNPPSTLSDLPRGMAHLLSFYSVRPCFARIYTVPHIHAQSQC